MASYSLPNKKLLLTYLALLSSAGWGFSQFSLTNGQGTQNYSTFQAAIYAANASQTAATIDIDFVATGGSVSLNSQLVIGLNSSNTGPGAGYVGLTIQGNGVTIDLNNADRAFFVASGAVDFQNLTISQGLAQGGNGGLGGGAGAGMGGAIFVANPQTITSQGQGTFTNQNLTLATAVTLTNVAFTDNQAVGGLGGVSALSADGIGGGGGMGGDGGTGKTGFAEIGGGGGGFGNNSTGGDLNGAWHGLNGAMIFTVDENNNPLSYAPAGGNGAGESDNGGLYGGGGGMGENDDIEDQGGGGGGVNGQVGNYGAAGNGGFGGGGGASTSSGDNGGMGGFGGGGGAANSNSGSPVGGNGGFGGGGGAPANPGSHELSGGFGGGGGDQASPGLHEVSGGFGGDFGYNDGNVAAGGNGAGLGGAIFVMDGASLTIKSSSFSNNSASANSPAGGSAAAIGDDMFIGADVTFDIAPGDSVTVGSIGGAGFVSSTTENHLSDPNANGGISVQGGGQLILSGKNYYSGQTVINSGTLTVASSASEKGTIAVIVGQNSGDNAILQLQNSASLVMNNANPVIEVAQSAGSTGTVVIEHNEGNEGPLIRSGEGQPVVAIKGGAGNGTLIVDSDLQYTVTNPLTGSLNLTQQGPGTTILAPDGTNTFTGAVTVSDGVLETSGAAASLAGTSAINLQDGVFRIGQSNGINNSASLNQSGGTFQIGMGGVQETLGAWNITGTTTFDFNNFGADISFSALNIGGALAIYNYNAGVDTIRILSGTAVGNLSQIAFYSDNGNTFLGNAELNGTLLQVQAIPEPSSLMLLGCGAFAVLLRMRRKSSR